MLVGSENPHLAGTGSEIPCHQNGRKCPGDSNAGCGLVSPFQGYGKYSIAVTQGAALGCDVAPFQG